jgi:hypothetical protein
MSLQPASVLQPVHEIGRNAMSDEMDGRLAERVRQAVYVQCAKSEVPTTLDLSRMLGRPLGVVRDTLRWLATQRVLVLQPNGEILMAEPFSAIPTPFLIRSGDTQWWGNCIWDALGIAAMLRLDAELITSCQCCGTRLEVGVARGERLTSGAGIAHFLVPARFWWDQIVFT